MNVEKPIRADVSGSGHAARNKVIDLKLARLDLRVGGQTELNRYIPAETPISVEVCGIGYAVMMATPADLRDYAIGFALTEGLIEHVSDIESIDAHEIEGGWILRIELGGQYRDDVFERARTRISESSCGLCGIDSIEEVLRPLPRVVGAIHTDGAAIARALAALPDFQPLNHATGAAHAAAFCLPDGTILAAREDVGRHNALDKLIGALADRGIDPKTGFILLSARCSFELVEKTVRAGCPMLVTISAPTDLAVERAKAAGLTLVTLARPDSALIVCDEKGMIA